MPRPQEVFISYSRKDKVFVRRLDEELKHREREAWVDWDGIPPGDTWEKTIYGAIEAFIIGRCVRDFLEGTIEGLRAAMQVDPGNAPITAHLGRRLADFALKPGRDPDEARRARGEADFLTRRARNLAPDSDEVKELRDEVVKLLGLKRN